MAAQRDLDPAGGRACLVRARADLPAPLSGAERAHHLDVPAALQFAFYFDLIEPEPDGQVGQATVLERRSSGDQRRVESAVDIDVRAQGAAGVVEYRYEGQDDADIGEVDVDAAVQVRAAGVRDVQHLELGGDLALSGERQVDDAATQVVAVHVEAEPGFAGRQYAIGIVDAYHGTGRHPQIRASVGHAVGSCAPAERAADDLVELQPGLDEGVDKIDWDRR